MDLAELLSSVSSDKDIDSIEVSMRRAENGYVVEVDYPKSMIANPSAEKARDIFASFSKLASGDEDSPHSPSDAIKALGNVVSELSKPPGKPLRKAHEEYVFGDIEGALKFIRETFSTAEKN